MSHGKRSSTGGLNISVLVQLAADVPVPEPVDVLIKSMPPKAIDVPNPEPVAVLGAMCKPTAISPVDAPPAPVAVRGPI